MGQQVTTYLDHQPPVLVGQTGARDFVAQTSVLSARAAVQIARVAGVSDAAPITEGYAMLGLHGKRVLTLLIGYDPGRRGGPWQLAEGRRMPGTSSSSTECSLTSTGSGSGRRCGSAGPICASSAYRAGRAAS